MLLSVSKCDQDIPDALICAGPLDLFIAKEGLQGKI
jgi:hypothetical protein